MGQLTATLRRVAYVRPGVYRISWSAFHGWLWQHIPEWEWSEGFKVGTHPLMEKREAIRVRERITLALCFWRDLDPRGFARARRTMPRIVIMSSRRSYYHIAGDICVVDLARALRASVWNLTTTLVHEATHAHLIHRGIPYTPELRDRIERFCVAQELALVQRMSDAD